MRLGRTARRVLWLLAAALLVSVFSLAGRGDGKPPTNEERVESLAREFACPECSGQSVAQSNAPAALNIRNAVAAMVADGRSDAEIRALVTDRFGEQVSLVPAAGGFVGLVWIVPVVVALLALAALGAVMVRWRRGIGSIGAASAQDRALVERFMAERAEFDRVEADVRR